MNIVEQLNQEQIEKLSADHEIPEFGPGDTLRIDVKVVEGSRERIQAFEGVCIARNNDGISSSFTIRKISYGEGVERVFPLYSPRIAGMSGRADRLKSYCSGEGRQQSSGCTRGIKRQQHRCLCECGTPLLL